MEREIQGFIRENRNKTIVPSYLNLEVRHDLEVARRIAHRRNVFLVLMPLTSIVIVVISLMGVTGFLEFTTGVFTLLIIHLSSLFIMMDLIRMLQINVLKSQLKYPELYTTDGRYYKYILSSELVHSYEEGSVELNEVYKESFIKEEGESN